MGLFNLFSTKKGLRERLPNIAKCMQELPEMYGSKYVLDYNNEKQFVYHIPIKVGRKITSNFYLLFETLQTDSNRIIVYGIVSNLSLLNSQKIQSDIYFVEEDSEDHLNQLVESINTDMSNHRDFEKVAFGSII